MTTGEAALEKRISDLAWSIKFGFWGVLAGASCFHIGIVLLVPGFESLFHDMLGGKPLPPVTQFIISCHWLLVTFSVALPVAGFAATYIKSPRLSIGSILTFFMIAALDSVFHLFALFIPLFATCQTMSGS